MPTDLQESHCAPWGVIDTNLETTILDHKTSDKTTRCLIFQGFSWELDEPLLAPTGSASHQSYLFLSSSISLFSAHPYLYQPNYHILNIAVMLHPSSLTGIITAIL